MREIRTYGSEGGGAARSPYPYQATVELDSGFGRNYATANLPSGPLSLLPRRMQAMTQLMNQGL